MPHDAAFHLVLHCLPKYAFGCLKYIRQALSISTAPPPLRDYVQVIKCIRRVKNCVETDLIVHKETARLFGYSTPVVEKSTAYRNKKTARLFGFKLSVIAHL